MVLMPTRIVDRVGTSSCSPNAVERAAVRRQALTPVFGERYPGSTQIESTPQTWCPLRAISSPTRQSRSRSQALGRRPDSRFQSRTEHLLGGSNARSFRKAGRSRTNCGTRLDAGSTSLVLLKPPRSRNWRPSFANSSPPGPSAGTGWSILIRSTSMPCSPSQRTLPSSNSSKKTSRVI